MTGPPPPPQVSLAGLRAAAEVSTVRFEVRRWSIATIFFGCIFLIVAGVEFPRSPIVALEWGTIGTFCALCGWANSRLATRVGLAVESSGLIAFGAFHAATPVLFFAATRVSKDWMIYSFFAGAPLLCWGTFGLFRLWCLHRAITRAPGPLAEATLMALRDEVLSPAFESQPDGIAYTTEEWGNQMYAWRGKLCEGFAVVVRRTGASVLIGTPDDMLLSDRGRQWLSRSRRVRLRIGRRKFRAFMSEADLTHLRDWLSKGALGDHAV